VLTNMPKNRSCLHIHVLVASQRHDQLYKVSLCSSAGYQLGSCYQCQAVLILTISEGDEISYSDLPTPKIRSITGLISSIYSLRTIRSIDSHVRHVSFHSWSAFKRCSDDNARFITKVIKNLSVHIICIS
jgi:hypothetical protein